MNLNKGERFSNRFTVLDPVRTGGTASIYKAYDDDVGRVVALKIFTVEGRDPSIVDLFWNRESAALSCLSHEAVVRCLDAGRDANSAQRFLVLEWIDGITLEEHLEKVGALPWEDFSARIGKQMLSALLHAADHNITHRDLAPGNVMVLPGEVIKIIDFGQAKVSTISIGRTVAAWHTAPYCPPEDDTGTYTYTRDAYSYAAIAVRSMVGRQLLNHESLYEAFHAVPLPVRVRSVLARALSREPSERYGTIIEFNAALVGEAVESESVDRLSLAIPIRLAPSVVERVEIPDCEDGMLATATDIVLAELNDTVAIFANETGEQSSPNRINLETQSYRLVVDIDSRNPDHLVVVGLVSKWFRLDSLYQRDRWIPQARFTNTIPARPEERVAAATAIRTLYLGLEEFHESSAKLRRREGGRAIAEWTRLLEALRHLARNGVPALRYTNLEVEGNRLIATVDNPEDAEEEQLRTIADDGTWVFRGEIESVRGNSCVLVSTRPRINLESIPGKGFMEIDWQQTKVALDRQARAVERFKSATLPNPRLGRILTGEDVGLSEPQFENIEKFFDEGLDAPKKEIVSRCGAGIDLLVTHGPPGTGKTKLIVELVRQALRTDPACKILLVSQTHVALDNALERLLREDPDVACVRIGSGSTEIDPRVAQCTVEYRGKLLRQQIEVASRHFLEERAKSLGVDRPLIELGLRALDVIGLREKVASHEKQLGKLRSELDLIASQLAEGGEVAPTTSQRSDRQLRSTILESDLDQVQSLLETTEAELASAIERLAAISDSGRELANVPDLELREWADMATEGAKQKAFGELMKLSEAWRLRFGQSDDFKTAIISSSSIVAGTCVGFCREDAASRATFDLCIIDEAGKATTTELLVPLAQCKRAVIVGDHHQLPAVLDHAIRGADLMERFGLTERQLNVQLFEELTRDLGAGGRGALTTQYRMRGSIGALVSACFYEGLLLTDDSLKLRKVLDLQLAGLAKAVTWLDPYVGAGSERFEQRVGTSYSSGREVQCVVAMLKRLVFIFQNALREAQWPSVGIITGYAAQATAIRAEIRRDMALDRLSVDCATVHTFQGREVDICIYSIGRRNREYRIGMLSDYRHLNVALSRARNFLVIIGSLEFCRNVPEPNPFIRIIKHMEESEDCDSKGWSDD